MKIETRSESTKNVNVTEPIDVDPGHALIVEMGEEFFRLRNGAFFEVRAIVLDQGDNGPAVGRFLTRAQHTGRLTRNGITCLEHAATLQRGSAGGEWKAIGRRLLACHPEEFENAERYSWYEDDVSN